MTRLNTEVPQVNENKDAVVPKLSDGEDKLDSGDDITSGNELMLEMPRIN